VAGSIVPFNTATADQNARMHEINAWIGSEAVRSGHVVFADTRAGAAAPDHPDRLSGSPDDLHPDVDGYRGMANALDAAIGRALQMR